MLYEVITVDPVTLGIGASPQGGNVSVWGDPTGGGNYNALACPTNQDYVLECYAYLAAPDPAMDNDDGEYWAIGVRGSTDSFGEPPTIGTYMSIISCTSSQPGSTGIGWFFFRTATFAELSYNFV